MPDHTIRRARRAAGLSARALAARAGTSHATLLAYEAGGKVPGRDTRERIIRAAGWVVDEALVRRTGTTIHGEETGEELAQVLLLADALPQRPAGPLAARPFPSRMPR